MAVAPAAEANAMRRRVTAAKSKTTNTTHRATASRISQSDHGSHTCSSASSIAASRWIRNAMIVAPNPIIIAARAIKSPALIWSSTKPPNDKCPIHLGLYRRSNCRIQFTSEVECTHGLSSIRYRPPGTNRLTCTVKPYTMRVREKGQYATCPLSPQRAQTAPRGRKRQGRAVRDGRTSCASFCSPSKPPRRWSSFAGFPAGSCTL